MSFNIPTPQEFFATLGAMDYFIFLINIVIFLGAKKILKFLNHNKTPNILKKKLYRLRWSNFLLFMIFSATTFIDDSLFQQIIMTATAGLGIFLFWEFEMYYIEKSYTKEEEVNGKVQKVETYQSDIFQWLATIVTVIISINLISDIWHWNSMLQTGSVVASIAAFLAITHSSWLPDNIGGLITLHKGHVGAGDVVKFNVDGEEILGYVGKITLTDTTIYHLVDKHPIYLRNSKLRDVIMHRLSKAESTSKDGILRYIDLNIGYSSLSERVEEFAEKVFEHGCEISKSINKDRGVRLEVVNNGDYAVTWRLFFYTNARNMKDSEFAMNRSAKDIAETFEDVSLDTPSLMILSKD